MIGRLSGRIELDEASGLVLVDVGGVGYLVRVPGSTLSTLRPGEPATLRVHTVFTQEQLALYGFATLQELRMFQLLITVDRVGPKLALAVLGSLGASGLVRALVTDDVRSLSSVPGVGKKTAQRLLLELREKLASVGEIDPIPLAAVSPAAAAAGPPDARSDAVDALVALGYPRAQASGAVETLWRGQPPDAPAPAVQDLLRAALVQLSRIQP